MDDDDQRFAVMARVERYLRELDAPHVARSAGRHAITFRHGWAKVDFAFRGLGEWTIVDISVHLLSEVPPSPELYRSLATAHRYPFAHPVVEEGGSEGTVRVALLHALLGDYLDREELILAVESMLTATAEVERAVRSRFGGRRVEWDGD